MIDDYKIQVWLIIVVDKLELGYTTFTKGRPIMICNMNAKSHMNVQLVKYISDKSSLMFARMAFLSMSSKLGMKCQESIDTSFRFFPLNPYMHEHWRCNRIEDAV